jgi:Phosphotransferase enzyme family
MASIGGNPGVVSDAEPRTAGPDAAEAERIRLAVGRGVVEAKRVNRGYANNRRWILKLDGGGTAFVKHADDANTAAWLRREFEVYEHLRDDFRPDVLGWYDDGELPVLVLEDLTACAWPPPWTPRRVDAVRETLVRVAAHPPLAGIRHLREAMDGGNDWVSVAEDPVPLLSLRLCSRTWLERALPTLVAAADPDDLDGHALLHCDVRSDNLCFRVVGASLRTILVDWNHVSVGNPQFDVAFWLPSLRDEDGPAPVDVLPDANPAIVAHVAGFFAARAGLPPIPTAPRVRDVQRSQLEVALPWAASVIGLPPPG